MKKERSKQKEDGPYGNTILLNPILVAKKGSCFTQTGCQEVRSNVSVDSRYLVWNSNRCNTRNG